MRTGWLMTGTVMWVLVGVAVYFQATIRDPGSVDISPGSDGFDVETSEDDIQRPREITIQTTWPESGVADFKFTDSNGEIVSKNDLLGTPWVASFVFTQCAGPCPRVTEAIKILHDHYKNKPVKFVTFTVDPKRDTPEVLQRYAKAYGADPERWYFLTGERDDLYSLIKGSFLMPVGEAPKPEPGWEIIHTMNACLVDPTGRVVGKYLSTKGPEMARLRKDLRRMLAVTRQPFAPSGSADQAGSSNRDAGDFE